MDYFMKVVTKLVQYIPNNIEMVQVVEQFVYKKIAYMFGNWKIELNVQYRI